MIFHFKKRFFIFLIGLLLSMAVLQLLNKNTKQDPVSTGFFSFFSEIQAAGIHFQSEISALIKKYLFLLDLRETNTKLKRQNKELKSQLQSFKEVLKENERLKKLFQFSSEQPFALLPAQIIGTDFLSKNELMTINKGSSHGVKKFMGVLHPEGVVGYIFRTSPHSSQVISLVNPLSSLPARNRRSRITGLISAHKKKSLLFKHLDKTFSENSNELKPGDMIITIKSEQFPAGLLVGRVLSLNHSLENLNPEAYVQPAVKFHSLEEVLVVLNPSHKQDTEKLKPSFHKTNIKKVYENKN